MTDEHTKTVFNIVFVVSHPDDESLWVGGLVSELCQLPFLNIHIICLSGGASGSIRAEEFRTAMKVSGCTHYSIDEEDLHEANEPQLSVTKKVEATCKKFGLSIQDIDILITHPPHGDEHRHPHHIQAYRELYDWTRTQAVPFAYFSTATIPYFDLRPFLQQSKRLGTLHILNMATCISNISFVRKYFSKSLKNFQTPRYYLQFQVSQENKEKMIRCYNSIDLEAHKKGYTSFSQNVESVYVMDEKGLAPFQAVIDSMEVPGRTSLFL